MASQPQRNEDGMVPEHTMLKILLQTWRFAPVLFIWSMNLSVTQANSGVSLASVKHHNSIKQQQSGTSLLY
jgi:hypothetical protein